MGGHGCLTALPEPPAAWRSSGARAGQVGRWVLASWRGDESGPAALRQRGSIGAAAEYVNDCRCAGRSAAIRGKQGEVGNRYGQQLVPSQVPLPAGKGAAEEDGIEQVESVDEITTSDKVSTFVLTEPIPVSGQEVETLIVGTDKKDKITGSSEGEILAGGEGKDLLKGGRGPDGFLFQNPDAFGKKEADKIKDFDSEEGDSILLDKEVFGLGKKIKLKVVTGNKAAIQAAQTRKQIIYDNKKGILYFNENGKEEGWGDGGLFVKLKGAPELGVDDFTFV